MATAVLAYGYDLGNVDGEGFLAGQGEEQDTVEAMTERLLRASGFERDEDWTFAEYGFARNSALMALGVEFEYYGVDGGNEGVLLIARGSGNTVYPDKPLLLYDMAVGSGWDERLRWAVGVLELEVTSDGPEWIISVYKE